MEHLQYPIGRFVPKNDYSGEEIAQFIHVLETAPEVYRQLLTNRTETDLTKTYREGSWTVQQLVHHVADIHLLNFLRLKKTLTEEETVATIIDMNAWAATPDAQKAPIEDSLLMFQSINQRFLYLLRSLDEQALQRSFYHPVRKIHLSLRQFIYMATWHVAHHRGHIELAFGNQPRPFVVG